MILLIPMLLAAGAVALILLVRRGRVRLTGPVCGACGYSVLGLSHMTCPECGNDLRRVGILTPRTPGRPRGPLGGIIVLTGAVLLVAFVSSLAIIDILPLWHSDSEQSRLNSPRSAAYREAIIHADGASYLPKRNGLPVEIELTSNSAGASPAPSSWMLVRPDGSYEFVASGLPRVVRPDGFGSVAVLEWMKAAGIDIAAPSVGEEAAEITGQTRLINRNSRQALAFTIQTNSKSMRSGSGNAPFAAYSYTSHVIAARPDWPRFVLLVLWFAIWISGIGYLLRRSRREHGK